MKHSDEHVILNITMNVCLKIHIWITRTPFGFLSMLINDNHSYSGNIASVLDEWVSVQHW